MPNIRAVDMLFLDDLFEMGGGYVLKFSDRTLAEFFQLELGINIDDPVYAKNGGSKGKRLRYFLQISDVATVVRTLRALWEYREALQRRSNAMERLPGAREQFLELIARLEGPKAPLPADRSARVLDNARAGELKSQLFALPSLQPQPRGYAFEKFLKALFDAHGLEARDPFRLRGEQIDGSFLLSTQVYLLEAKWQEAACGVDVLHTFHGKIEQKAAWTRGLFISDSGFSLDGVAAFGRGKRVICMDGFDLYEVVTRNLSLAEVLDHKVRHAAETGVIFARVRDLFPQ
jgi:hypothetical protein